MKITVERDIIGEGWTSGKLYINDGFFCYTMEDQDRHLEEFQEDKVDGQTAIPRGTYKLIIDFSQRFQRQLPRLLDVPGFTGVRIHTGNDASDTHGCILVGTGRSGSWLSNSRIAFVKLMEVLDNAYDRGEEITVDVR